MVVGESSEEEGEGDAVDQDDGVITDAATDVDNIAPSESTYQQTKEMGNADHQVS